MSEGNAFELIGGEPAVRGLVNCFYALMDLEPDYAALRAVHGSTLDSARDKLFWFLCGWLGGPQHYVERFGHPRLRARHLPFPIGIRERDQWLACMAQAMREHMTKRKTSPFPRANLLTDDEENQDVGFPLSLREFQVLKPFDESHFKDFRDADDRTAGFLELFIEGQYTWLSLATVSSLQISPPSQLRDLLWAPTRVVTQGGAISGFMPVLYAGSAAATEGASTIRPMPTSVRLALSGSRVAKMSSRVCGRSMPRS